MLKHSMLMAAAGKKAASIVAVNDNLDNAVYVGSYDPTEAANPQTVFISDDGTKMYIGNWGTDLILLEYTLGTAYALSSATYVGTKTYSFTTNNGTGYCTGLYVKPDGTKIYASDSDRNIWQIDLSIAWDITSGNATTESGYVNTGDATSVGAKLGLIFSDDGTKFFYTNSNGNLIEFTLTGSAWELGVDGATHITTALTPTYDTGGFLTFSMNRSGDKAYLSQLETTIKQYAISPNWNSASIDETTILTSHDTTGDTADTPIRDLCAIEAAAKFYAVMGGNIHEWTMGAPVPPATLTVSVTDTTLLGIDSGTDGMNFEDGGTTVTTDGTGPWTMEITVNQWRDWNGAWNAGCSKVWNIVQLDDSNFTKVDCTYTSFSSFATESLMRANAILCNTGQGNFDFDCTIKITDSLGAWGEDTAIIRGAIHY